MSTRRSASVAAVFLLSDPLPLPLPFPILGPRGSYSTRCWGEHRERFENTLRALLGASGRERGDDAGASLSDPEHPLDAACQAVSATAHAMLTEDRARGPLAGERVAEYRARARAAAGDWWPSGPEEQFEFAAARLISGTKER